MARNKEKIKKLIETKKEALLKYEDARLAILATGQSYQIKNGDNTRVLTYADLDSITKLIDQTEAEIEVLEDKLDGCTSRSVIIGGAWR